MVYAPPGTMGISKSPDQSSNISGLSAFFHNATPPPSLSIWYPPIHLLFLSLQSKLSPNSNTREQYPHVGNEFSQIPHCDMNTRCSRRTFPLRSQQKANAPVPKEETYTTWLRPMTSRFAHHVNHQQCTRSHGRDRKSISFAAGMSPCHKP